MNGRSFRDTGTRATAFLSRPVDGTGITPAAVTTDTAPNYHPALAAALSEVEHRMGKMGQQQIEWDRRHLKGRTRRIWGC